MGITKKKQFVYLDFSHGKIDFFDDYCAYCGNNIFKSEEYVLIPVLYDDYKFSYMMVPKEFHTAECASDTSVSSSILICEQCSMDPLWEPLDILLNTIEEQIK